MKLKNPLKSAQFALVNSKLGRKATKLKKDTKSILKLLPKPLAKKAVSATGGAYKSAALELQKMQRKCVDLADTIKDAKDILKKLQRKHDERLKLQNSLPETNDGIPDTENSKYNKIADKITAIFGDIFTIEIEYKELKQKIDNKEKEFLKLYKELKYIHHIYGKDFKSEIAEAPFGFLYEKDK